MLKAAVPILAASSFVGEDFPADAFNKTASHWILDASCTIAFDGRDERHGEVDAMLVEWTRHRVRKFELSSEASFTADAVPIKKQT